MRKNNKILGTVLCMTLMLSQFLLAFGGEVTAVTSQDSEIKSDVTLGLNQPYGLSADSYGVVYIADTYNNMIKKISANGLELVAGGFDGKNVMGMPRGALKDGALLDARFRRPRDVFAGSNGVLYVADTENYVIRKIENGKVSTFAGMGVAGYADGAANAAQFNMPSAVIQDKEGKLYVADTLNNCIRQIEKDGRTTTVSFKPDMETLTSAALNEPSDIMLDANGVLYVLDSGNQAIKKIDNGVISLVAGYNGEVDKTGYGERGLTNDIGEKARFNFPKCFAMDSKGNIFVTDSWNQEIRVILPSGKVRTYVGSPFVGNVVGSLAEARFNTPTGIVIKNNVIVVSDMWNNEIKEVAIDYSNPAFGVSEATLKTLIDSAKTSTEWQYWESKKVVALDKPIVEFESTVYLPFKSMMVLHGFKISWDNVNKRVVYTKGETEGYIDSNSGMKIFDNNSYMKLEELSSILDIDMYQLNEEKAIIGIQY